MGHLSFRSRVVYIFPHRRIKSQGKLWKGNHNHADKPLIPLDTLYRTINPCRVEFQQEFDIPSTYKFYCSKKWLNLDKFGCFWTFELFLVNTSVLIKLRSIQLPLTVNTPFVETLNLAWKPINFIIQEAQHWNFQVSFSFSPGRASFSISNFITDNLHSIIT